MLYVSGQQEKLRIRRVCNVKLVTEKKKKYEKKKKKRVSPLLKVATNFCVTCVANFNRNYSHVDTLANVTGKQGSEVDSSTTHTHTPTQGAAHTRLCPQEVQVESETFLIELFLSRNSPKTALSAS